MGVSCKPTTNHQLASVGKGKSGKPLVRIDGQQPAWSSFQCPRPTMVNLQIYIYIHIYIIIYHYVCLSLKSLVCRVKSLIDLAKKKAQNVENWCIGGGGWPWMFVEIFNPRAVSFGLPNPSGSQTWLAGKSSSSISVPFWKVNLPPGNFT